MNKKLILISLCMLATCASAFGQVDGGKFTDSARSKATATMFLNDSDYVIADDIFLVERSFFSAGFQPSLTLGQDDSMGKMSAFWAMPINENMTVGIAGEYRMDASRVDGSKFLGNTSGGTIPTAPLTFVSLPATGNYMQTGKTLTENSSFNIRPVFRFGQFAVSYRIYREGSHVGLENSATLIPTGETTVTNGNYTSTSTWEHEIGFAWKVPGFIKFYVPIGVTIFGNGYNETYTHDSQTAPNLTTNVSDINQMSRRANLYINPEVGFPVEIGPINNFRTGINFNVDVFNPGAGSQTTTTTSGNQIVGAATAENKVVVAYDKISYIEIGTFIETTMQWNTWEDKISFIFEPILGFDYSHRGNGSQTTTTNTTAADGSVVENVTEPTSSSSTNSVNTYLTVNIGSVIKPVDWFEFRAGLNYGFNWNAATTTTDYSLLDAGSVSTYQSTLTSQFEIYSGFGFILGEDFFLDVYISAGNFEDDKIQGANAPLADARYDLFDIRNYGFELTYRF